LVIMKDYMMKNQEEMMNTKKINKNEKI
jgi:hypothetical protein